MKIIISENQLKKLLEQPESRFGPEQYMSPSERAAFHSGDANKAGAALMSGSKKQMDLIHSIDPHTAMMVIGIGSAFIPVVGPFIAAGIGLADAAIYYKEGDTKSAGMSALFSIIPGVGPIVSKIPGVKQLGVKGMSALASKLSKGIKITDPLEIGVVNAIGKNKELVQGAVNGHVKALSQQAAAKTTNSSLKSSLLGIAKTGLTYGSVGLAYDYGYDGIMKKIEQNNIDKLNQKSGINKKQ
jgi:hypothetical protein